MKKEKIVKIVVFITCILLIVLFTFGTTFTYIPTSKAATLKDYKDKVAELEKKQDNIYW